MADVILEVKDLKKYFKSPRGTVHAVDDVTLHIDKGTTMGIVGESGCGKSTLGRTIIHLQNATDGKVFLNGEDVTNVSGHKLRQVREKM
ncbi:MAG: ATP-binding cassette domain-containing protein, partial [Firmicutes bacterium]|nr:ATP-binding cassette domain-containing protein [Bacillota bacterium]